MKRLSSKLLFSVAFATLTTQAAFAVDTAESFYNQYQNNVSAIPLPDCAENSIGLTPTEIRQIILAHNRARKDAQIHAPSGSSALPAMRWDCDAAKVAKEWADDTSGNQGHSPFDWRKQRYSSHTGLTGGAAALGENLFWQVGTSPSVVAPVISSVNAWIDEGLDYNHADGSCSAGKACLHYTQVVWRESSKIGCAIVRGQIMFPGDSKVWPHGYFLGCTYHNAGNINREPPLIQHPDWYYQAN